MLVFGDSLSDVGNAWRLWGEGAVPSPPHWRGRRCDGPLWVDQLAEALGLPPLQPSLADGGGHACGGARSGIGFSPGRGAPNLLEQLRRWQQQRGDRPVAAATLVLLRAGANDYLDVPPPQLGGVGPMVNGHLLEAVDRLAQAGLTRFLVPAEMPWGSSPIQWPGLDAARRAALNAAIAEQNAALAEALQRLAERRRLTIVQPDFHGLLQRVQADPAAHGFTELERPALAEPLRSQPAPPAAGILWWDGWGHLTSAFHGLLAAEARRALALVGLTLGLAAAATAAPAAPAAQGRPALCILEQNGRTALAGPCRVQSGPDGGFTLAGPGAEPLLGGITALTVAPLRPALAEVRGLTLQGVNSRWGPAVRSSEDPACWLGSDFAVCVY